MCVCVCVCSCENISLLFLIRSSDCITIVLTRFPLPGYIWQLLSSCDPLSLSFFLCLAFFVPLHRGELYLLYGSIGHVSHKSPSVEIVTSLAIKTAVTSTFLHLVMREKELLSKYNSCEMVRRSLLFSLSLSLLEKEEENLTGIPYDAGK